MSLPTATRPAARPAHVLPSRPPRPRRSARWLLVAVVFLLMALTMTALVLLAGEQAAGGAGTLPGRT